MTKHVLKTLLLILILLNLAACGEKPEIIDYSDINNWAYYSVGENKPADLFLICPTVFGGEENQHNMSLKDEESKQNFTGALNMEKGIYENELRMYAPFYQQAGLNVYKMDSRRSKKFFDTAYADIRKAFVHYMENENNNRPIVIAGFSQGSDMALRLLKEFFSEEKYQNKLVAAYLIGWRITEQDLKKYPHLKMAQNENDTGVIVSFNSEAEFVKKSIIVPEKTYGINPLNWKTDSTPALASLNLGACFTDYSGSIVNEFENFTGAYLDSERGTLKITDVNPDEYPPILDIFEHGVFHIYDYLFFYRNLQHNVEVRLKNYMENIN
ncbi:MAG: DUF3089 domain-containing protein [Candidatus Muiribacteriota bacterium]